MYPKRGGPKCQGPIFIGLEPFTGRGLLIFTVIERLTSTVLEPVDFQHDLVNMQHKAILTDL